MSFLQIIDMHASKVDEIMTLDKEWRAATQGKRTLRRSIVGGDRNDPKRYLSEPTFTDIDIVIDIDIIDETSAASRRPA